MRNRIILAAFLIVVICISLSACSLTKPVEESPIPTAEASQTPVVEETPKPESAEVIALREETILKAKSLAAGYDYDGALAVLGDSAIINEQVTALVSEIEAAKSSLVPYEGDIKHIFFHSLIVYPEMIFKDKTTPMGGYNAGFSEKAELLKILPQLYERGYVLYDISKCFEMENGKMVRREILLPPGKQPLILSVDDVAYAYGDGYAQKLVVKEDGSLVNLVKNPQGTVEEMADGDVFGVVAKFVAEHPDFSYKGHRGTLALTGYQGAFGYSFEEPADQEQIHKVVSALKAQGWNFASHSYTHNGNNFFGGKCDPEKIRYDTNKWATQIAPFFGPTNLFIAPFGYRVKQPGLQYILDAGFQIYCTVDNKVVNELYDDYAIMSRIEIGGYSMTYFKDVLNKNFFNVDEVYDSAGRPPVI